MIEIAYWFKYWRFC